MIDDELSKALDALSEKEKVSYCLLDWAHIDSYCMISMLYTSSKIANSTKLKFLLVGIPISPVMGPTEQLICPDPMLTIVSETM